VINSPLGSHIRLLEIHERALKKLGINTVRDLLYYFPNRYGDTSEIGVISSLRKGDSAVVFGRIFGLKTKKAFRKKIPMAEAVLEDGTGRIKIIWFHQAYLAKMIKESSLVRLEGKVSERKGELYFSNPKVENANSIPNQALFDKDKDPSSNSGDRFYPVYPETKGITSNWIYHAIQKLFKAGVLKEISDPIPKKILDTYKLPNLRTSLIWIHSPQKQPDALAARKRFAFEEVFFIQLEKQRAKKDWHSHGSFKIRKGQSEIAEFVARFPFPLTSAQNKALEQILSDFNKGEPMSRLLEGDVGSGKTAVAAATAYAVITSKPQGQDFDNLQTAYMVPTEILAKQHFDSFIENFTHTGVQMGLITGSGCLKFPSKVNPQQATPISRPQFLKWVANGEIPIVIGTHTLIQKAVRFKHLAFVIIDEQHRFGTAQRQRFREKEGRIPHLLSMTATPIPRTLALTIYGDLDLSLLDELPPGRKWPETEIVIPDRRQETYERIRAEIKAGRQAYVICPRIDEPDPTKELALQAKSVKEEAKRLKKDVFPEFEIGILHSKMPARLNSTSRSGGKPSKEEVMKDFAEGKIQILVSTSVVEVGVNVPNATMIIIEGAERFGLAQLHQLRGRVMRSSHQPYCFIFTDSKSQTSRERLGALGKAKSGFELAEFDLNQRGAGELSGRKQWGLSDLAMEAIKNIKMVEAARNEAQSIISTDPELKNYPLLHARLSENSEKIHFE
jgi:ATP-dependent DNA helicase RecG